MGYKIIAVDFDGTLCEDQWPNEGAPNIEVINYLKEQKGKGAKLILWTCRVGTKLTEAVRWSAGQGIVFDAVNANLPETIQKYGNDSRKVYADEYIDNKSVLVSQCKSGPKASVIARYDWL